MRLTRAFRWAVLAAFILSLEGAAVAQTAAFTGTGRLGTNTQVWAYGVSPNGSYVVGDAVGADGKTQAFIWSATGGLHGIGFLNNTYKETHARDVAVSPSTGDIKICGYGKDLANSDQAFLWSGNASGVGTFTAIPRLSGGTSSHAYALVIVPGTIETVYVTGDSTSSAASSGKPEGFRWRSDLNSTLGLGFLGGSLERYSVGFGIAYTDKTEIAGTSRSTWSSAGPREAARWVPTTGDPADPGGWGGHNGLTRVCGGEGWQILAGPNGIAETQAQGTNIQVTTVGTVGLSPDTVVVSAGPGNILKGITNPQGDDVEAPAGVTPNGGESIYRAISPNGRYQVGDSVYVNAPTGYRMAFLHDVKNRDYSSPDNCGGFGFSWPLAFLTVNNDGTPANDNYSQANGVSNGSAMPGRDGLVAVGYSYYESSQTGGVDSDREAFICLIQSGRDIWFLRQQGADPSDYGARAAAQFKDMRNLQWLLTHDFQLNLAGWQLREATAVTDDGQIVVGYGLHNGVEEGFVATVPGLPHKGACCHRPSLECTLDFQASCTGEWLGPDSVCTRCCPKPFADGDQDGDIDMNDFAIFQACINTPTPDVFIPGCECWDIDSNGVIDDTDFTRAFVVCGTGPEIPADPNCQ